MYFLVDTTTFDILAPTKSGSSVCVPSWPPSHQNITAKEPISSQFPSRSSLERELAALIASGNVSGRIDAPARALLCTKEDARGATYRAALDAAQQYLRGTRALLVRAAMMRHGLIQRQAPG